MINPETGFIRDSVESVDESSNTVMKFSAATLSTSLAISALPDDFATPLADSLADMNIYFVAILVALLLNSSGYPLEFFCARKHLVSGFFYFIHKYFLWLSIFNCFTKIDFIV